MGGSRRPGTRVRERCLPPGHSDRRRPTGARHRLENPGSEPLFVIEVQSGDYFGEDDIERFADDYRRT